MAVLIFNRLVWPFFNVNYGVLTMQRIDDNFYEICDEAGVPIPKSFSNVKNSEKWRILRIQYQDTVSNMIKAKDWVQMSKVFFPNSTNFMSYLDRYDNLIESKDDAVATRFILPNDFYSIAMDRLAVYGKDSYDYGEALLTRSAKSFWADFGIENPVQYYLNIYDKDQAGNTINTLDLIKVVDFNDEGRADEELQTSYKSRNWLRHLQTGQEIDYFPTDSDYTLLLDAETIKFGTLSRYYRRMGWDYQKWEMDYKNNLQEVYRINKPSQPIAVGGGRTLKVTSNRLRNYIPRSQMEFD